MRLSLSFAAVTVALTTVSTAALADGPTFGSANQLAISSDSNLQLTHTSVTQGGGTTTTFTFLPAADYFVINGLSLGGFALAEVVGGSTVLATSTTVGVGARVGYNVAFSDTFSFWPKLGLGIDHTSGGLGETVVTASIYAPFLVRPAPHFFLGLGPIFTTELTNSESDDGASTPSGLTASTNAPKTTTFGLAFTVGGWLAL